MDVPQYKSIEYQFRDQRLYEDYYALFSIGWEYWASPDVYYRDCRTSAYKQCVFQYTVSGEGTLIYNQKAYSLKPGQAFLIERPGQYQYYRSPNAKHWELKFITLNISCLKIWSDLAERFGRVFDLPADSAVMRCWDGIYRAALNNEMGSFYTASGYSFQRAFAEAYRLRACRQAFYLGGDGGEQLEAEIQAEKRYLRRETPMPQFEPLPVQRMIQTGKVSFDVPCSTLRKDRAYTQIGPMLKGYPADALEEHLSDEAQTFAWEPSCETAEDVSQIVLENGYATCRFPYNATGFLCMTVECAQACTVYLLFDEILTDGDVDFLRLTNCNCFKYDLDAGTHRMMTFAPYTMMYLKIAARGVCRASNVRMLQYQHPAPEFQIRLPVQKQLREIADAAVRTYRQNALDLFMDCPSRERAGWLCDSFFTARTEHVLTGQCAVEKAFLENFLLAKRFAYLPDGMLPMCYPADHYDGNFIPNWAMWFVLELDEYIRRSGDCTFAERAKPRVYGLLQYFAAFENEYGLLEKLEKWVFVEWSRANDPDVVQDVNFPTNMLYARMLQIAGNLYSDAALLEKSQKLHETIRQRSFNGSFFTDNERRTEQGLVNPGNITEVCQYYAFFMGTADKQTYPALWQTLVRDFGPHRAADRYPDVAAANAFIGDYLRLELLYLDGQTEKLLQDLKEYFTPMAERTGTLWEHDQPSASCCHGFASHVLYWLAKIYGTEKTQYAGA